MKVPFIGPFEYSYMQSIVAVKSSLVKENRTQRKFFIYIAKFFSEKLRDDFN